MLNASLRRSGGSYIMTLPLSYIEQNHLEAGARLNIEINGSALTVKPQKARPSLAQLLKATPRGLNRAKAWDEMGSAGGEL